MALTKKEEDILFDLAESITGTHQNGEFRKDVLARNVEKRMSQLKIESLEKYLAVVKSDSAEYGHFVSDLTIHTTSWFRERPHYVNLYKAAVEFYKQYPNQVFKLWSAACSSGEEVYSAILILEKVRLESNFKFDYQVYGSDIDPISVQKATTCIYPEIERKSIDAEFSKFLLVGTGRAEGYFTIDKDLRKKAHFFVQSLNEDKFNSHETKFHHIFCRNVLIYFTIEKQDEIIKRLEQHLAENGVLVLGHCDLFPHKTELTSIGNSSFLKSKNPNIKKSIIPAKMKILKPKVLVVDDSATIRLKLNKILNEKYEVYEAQSADKATELVSKHNFFFITLDLNMPGESGASWLQRQREQGLPTPTVIISDSNPQEAEKVFGALNFAQDYIIKSKLHSDPQSLLDLISALTTKSADKNNTYQLRPFKSEYIKPEIILVGASTGGPEALIQLVNKLERDFPPIIIVQHISAEFSRALLNRLCLASGLMSGEIGDGQPLQKGKIYFATGDYHLVLKQKSNQLFIEQSSTDKVNGHRPSIDILFKSAALCSRDSIGILLTGMGSDGAEGLLKLAETGKCYTMAQDAESSIVFGMPDKAIKLGAAAFVGNVSDIKKQMESFSTKKMAA